MKKGQIETAAILTVILLIVLGGTAYTGMNVADLSKKTTTEFTIDYKYIGDPNTKLVYDKTKCNIISDNLINFKSLEQAHKLGFKDAKNCI